MITRERFGHSPSSWKSLWQQVFTELESTEFAESRVVVEASFQGEFDNKVIPKTSNQPSLLLFWSVRIV